MLESRAQDPLKDVDAVIGRLLCSVAPDAAETSAALLPALTTVRAAISELYASTESSNPLDFGLRVAEFFLRNEAVQRLPESARLDLLRATFKGRALSTVEVTAPRRLNRPAPSEWNADAAVVAEYETAIRALLPEGFACESISSVKDLSAELRGLLAVKPFDVRSQRVGTPLQALRDSDSENEAIRAAVCQVFPNVNPRSVAAFFAHGRGAFVGNRG